MLATNQSDFDFLEIGLASPDRIRFWSYGEVEKPETINYRTFKPERKGLFCEKIFGPVKDWECSCGKYRRVRYRGIVCERCGVEVTHSKVRRERMGHIELAAPVTHIWFLKGIPTYMGLLLDLSTRQLEEVIYYDSYIVTEVDGSMESVLSPKQLLSITEYMEYQETHEGKFKADIGASAIKKLLSGIDLKKTIKELRKDLTESKGQKRLKITKRLRIVEALFKSGNRPEWMILDAIPVMPPDLRPMVQLEGGRFATSDLNDLYRRVVNRNNRLKRLMDIGAPEMIVKNEKRMLQEAVDVLISNGKRGRSVTGSNGRPLKSLGNIIEGKQGRFRQNLLGKRVDYSARSVIVVGPKLKTYQCGLPKEMALELFKPFIIRKLVEYGIVSNVKSAKRKIEKREVAVWDVLEEIIKGQPVLLNRAPTLHRLGIQAFEPILVEGSAIQIHPLVCTAFNADFDGDQMAVHVPLSFEAQAECKFLIMANNNILSPSSGRSIVTPTQDMVLGCYYLTVENHELNKLVHRKFRNSDEAQVALDSGVISIQSPIVVRLKNNQRIETTMGRVIFNNAITKVMDRHGIEYDNFVNEKVGKKELAELIYNWYIKYGNEITSELADCLKDVGFKYSTKSGISISIDDLTVPKNKPDLLEQARKDVEALDLLLHKNSISVEEKRQKGNDIWRSVTQDISDSLEKEMGVLNNLYIMANSGARGNIDQVRQLAGMRGLMSDSQGRTIEVPIRSNFKEGLSLTEYFISAYGARKGLVDTALRTADSGYLTRRLVDVAQDVMITIEDCGTEEGVEATAIKDGVKTLVDLAGFIEGRVCLEEIKNEETGEILIKPNELITRSTAKLIQDKTSKTNVLTRSVYHCRAPRGLCQKCYGLDLATAKMINIGDAVGIIAAQSIGEPGTQLTMRTFHTGGVDLRKASLVEISSAIDGKVEFSNELIVKQVSDDDGKHWISVSEGDVVINSGKTQRIYPLSKGSILSVKPDDSIKKDQIIATYDPHYLYFAAEEEGVSTFLHLGNIEDSPKELVVNGTATGMGELFVYNPKVTKKVMVSKATAEKCVKGIRISAVDLQDDDIVVGGLVKELKKIKTDFEVEFYPGQAYPFSSGAQIYTKENSKVATGDILIKERAEAGSGSKTSDIVQGLPKIEELFEARKPKEAAVLAEFDGVIEIDTHKTYRSLYLTSEEGVRKEYKLPLDIKLRVCAGKKVEKGSQLCEGGVNPHDILATKGVTETQCFLSTEVQKVYCSQGVSINSKHIEVIVRQMTRKINVVDMGDSTFLLNELIDVKKYNEINEDLKRQEKRPSLGDRVLLGITRASLNTDSFISSSSFQQTASVLTKAATEGQRDPMLGLKENVIMGRLIPAGTGSPYYKNLSIKLNERDTAEKVEEVVESVND